MENIFILLVEDNPDDQELAQWALKKMSHHTSVTVARDGVEALALLLGDGCTGSRQVLPDLLLLDLSLPRLDGIDVLRRLRSDNRTKNLRVIALTSSEDPFAKKRLEELGVIAFMSKPLNGNLLERYL